MVELILGTARLTHAYGITAEGAPSPSESVGLLAAARELGVRTLDTAPAYGDAEVMIGIHASDLAVHTKVAHGTDPAASLAASLERLGRSEVDVLHLHDPDAVLEPSGRSVAAAHALVGEGTRALGASVYTPAQFDAAVEDPRVTVVQAPLNVLDRRIGDDRLTTAVAAGTRVLARSVLLQGLLADPTGRGAGRVPALDAALAEFATVAALLDRTPEELALGWVRSRPGVSGVVVGVEGVGHLRRLAQVLAGPVLAPEELAVLTALPLPTGDAVDPRGWTAASPR